jgi:hypothetical protein
MRRATFLLGLLAVALAPLAATAQATDLAAHRAVYQLTLASSRGDIIGASGTMAYEMVDACDGWAVRQRLRMNVTDRENREIEMGTDYATFESKDGLSMRFNMRQTTETAVTSETEGTAKLERLGGPGEVQYKVPEDATKSLPPVPCSPRRTPSRSSRRRALARNSCPSRCWTAPPPAARRIPPSPSSAGTSRRNIASPRFPS